MGNGSETGFARIARLDTSFVNLHKDQLLASMRNMDHGRIMGASIRQCQASGRANTIGGLSRSQGAPISLASFSSAKS